MTSVRFSVICLLLALSAGATTFGVISGATGERQVQFTLKLVF